MGDGRPYTDAELQAGTEALHPKPAYAATATGVAQARDDARRVLEAVLPQHAARIRQEVAEEIAAAIWRECGRRHPARTDALTAADIAREHATTPTEGDQDAEPVD